MFELRDLLRMLVFVQVLMETSPSPLYGLQSPKIYAEMILGFFGLEIRDETTHYCPVKHMTTRVKDLCFYVSYSRRSRNAAKDNCAKRSQRLVELDSNQTWYALRSHLNREDYYQTNDASAIKIFHIGLLKYNATVKAFVWNHTNVAMDKRYMCTIDTNSTINNRTCAELIVYNSYNVSFKCLKLVECNRMSRYSICEWRGAHMKNFSSHLTTELTKSYISIVGVLLLHVVLLGLICFIHSCRTKDQIKELVERHANETNRVDTIEMQ
jgi:hypothetical protein